MYATDILSSEHRVIEQVIGAVDAALAKFDAGEAVRPAFFVDVVRFIRDFADGYHHGKEEDVLFEAMAQEGMDLDEGPVGVMLHEHARARDLTAALHAAAERWVAGDAGAFADVSESARAYSQLLAQHILMEDTIVFPMAEQVISPKAMDAIAEAFRRKEHELAEEKSPKASYENLARALCIEVGVDPEAPPKREVEFSCHAR